MNEIIFALSGSNTNIYKIKMYTIFFEYTSDHTCTFSCFVWSILEPVFYFIINEPSRIFLVNKNEDNIGFIFRYLKE